MVEPTTKLIAYSFIGIVGVLGNSFVLLSIFKVTNMHSITKKFIANLATVDLLINLVNMPWKIMNLMYPDLSDNEYWIALLRCNGMPYISESLTAALINTLVALTIDRYVAIVHPFSIITNRHYTIMMCLIWSFALIFSIPEMLSRHLSSTKCKITWPSDSLKTVYYGFDLFENCIIPMCIIIFCNFVIWRMIKQRKIPGEGIGNERIRERMQKKKVRITKVILAITTYFVLSGLPLYIAFLVYEFNRNEQNQDRNHTIHFWLDWYSSPMDNCFEKKVPKIPLIFRFALTHLFVNPFLSCLLSKKLRNSFKKLVWCGAEDTK